LHAKPYKKVHPHKRVEKKLHRIQAVFQEFAMAGGAFSRILVSDSRFVLAVPGLCWGVQRFDCPFQEFRVSCTRRRLPKTRLMKGDVWQDE
jgi:hypothetical protein